MKENRNVIFGIALILIFVYLCSVLCGPWIGIPIAIITIYNVIKDNKPKSDG